MLRVKICGITRPDDARTAVALGADALGFVFYEKSPRHISFGDAAAIAESLPPHVARVGVFVQPEPALVEDAVARAGLTAIQIHGVPVLQEVPQIAGVPTIWALPVKTEGLSLSPERLPEEMPAVLLDSFHPTLAGGTGTTFDWSHAVPLARSFRIVLAGGLTPQNVSVAVKMVQPYGVDVSSGVERAPGIKDDTKLQLFFENLRDFRHDWTIERDALFPLAG